MRSNYEIQKKNAQAAFACCDMDAVAERFSLNADRSHIYLRFLGHDCRISRADGLVELHRKDSDEYEEASFEIALTLYDILSRPGIKTAPSEGFVSMQHLATLMHAVSAPANNTFYSARAGIFDHREDALRKTLEDIGAVLTAGADVSAVFDVFSGLKLLFRFWSSDEEFGPQIQFFWDPCVLEDMHYETVWYVNGAFLRKLTDAFIAQPAP